MKTYINNFCVLKSTKNVLQGKLQNCSQIQNINNYVNITHSDVNNCKFKCYKYENASHLANECSFKNVIICLCTKRQLKQNVYKLKFSKTAKNSKYS